MECLRWWGVTKSLSRLLSRNVLQKTWSICRIGPVWRRLICIWGKQGTVEIAAVLEMSYCPWVPAGCEGDVRGRAVLGVSQGRGTDPAVNVWKWSLCKIIQWFSCNYQLDFMLTAFHLSFSRCFPKGFFCTSLCTCVCSIQMSTSLNLSLCHYRCCPLNARRIWVTRSCMASKCESSNSILWFFW